MAKDRKTVDTLSYGLSRPTQLLEKLELDAAKLCSSPNPYDVFNFIVTAAVLAEWTKNYYKTDDGPTPFGPPTKVKDEWTLPGTCEKWITDTTCLPNPAGGVTRHIQHMLSICAHTANASKHFHWGDRGQIEAIGDKPPIKDWYQYFFTSTAPDLYVTYRGENYGLQQIKGTLLQFYRGLISQLEHTEQQKKD
ncbi:hypothetical protein Clim_0649 [Chlorobium limicola DSM 245]|uniref:Uncharacterized protein n=1 Tax=Chlorobium limicola (strain DSM 245 / NBRC 103803 / 6330) TaxID=290315 RepID=B3EH55_CHLL2|nr:hypothetical protein [Chlorobium limicola]ACD89735.1 hypothetical protein Clim_0649 [Chlorobium limicola DSM 245]